jgi:hypothetical protein
MTQDEINQVINAYYDKLSEIATHARHNLETQHKRWFEDLQSAPRSVQPGRLLSFGRKVFSQNDEDGIIQEIFQRIGTTNKRFIEFGVEDGTECNSRLLLMDGWKGLWIDGSPEHVARMQPREGDAISAMQLFITAENIDQALGEWSAGTPDSPAEIDLLSIDIDGNDFWVWQAITSVRPRVVVIEYNASFPPPVKFVQPYVPEHRWDGTSYSGASLSALAELGEAKGYSLVGCCLTGVNAFFVRHDLLVDSSGNDLFHAPYTAAEHYELPRYEQATYLRYGHPPKSGPNAYR